jgi:hypothetical protein
LWRRKEPVLRPEHARFVTEVTTALQDAVRLHGELPVDRDVLLAHARRGALAGRGFVILGRHLTDEMAKEPGALVALRALERATCSLVAHAQSPPDPAGALRPDEVDTLIGDDLRAWMERR